MMVMMFSLCLTCFVISAFCGNLFSFQSRLMAVLLKFLNASLTLWKLDLARFSLSLTMFLLVFVNLLGNIPLVVASPMFYALTMSVSLLFWIPLMVCVFYTQWANFLAHLLPYGAPEGLSLVLPMIELFSQIIRPLTLTVRLSTNLSAGHIMLFMFSYFSVLSVTLSPILYVVMGALLILELAISVLQGYIFVSLFDLYFSEVA